MHSELHQLLILARAKIEAGWLQGDATDGKNVCAQYAIHSSGYDVRAPSVNAIPAVVSHAERLVLSIVNKGCEPWVNYPSVPTWNDMGGRTKAEVLAVFDEAIRQTAPEPDPWRPDPWPQARFTSVTTLKALVPWWHTKAAAEQICAATPTEEKTKELVGV